MGIAILLHVLAAVIWVGGMFFAYVCLRPVAAGLDAPVRLKLWADVLGRFFGWVWTAVVVLLATGFWMIFSVLGGMKSAGPHVHLMLGIGVLMMLLTAHVYFAPLRRLRLAVAGQDWAAAGKNLSQVRVFVGVNLVLGLLVAAVGSGGRYLIG